VPARLATVLVAVALLAGGLVACRVEACCTPPPASIAPASPVEGVVLTVDSGGLADVRSFELRTASGATLRFKIGTLESPTAFPLGHLGEHQATAEPIRVFFRTEGETLVAYRLEDASVPSPT